ncbi:nitroreductase/quinone reductase family protein [Cellulomonas cellasea]|uniref:Cation-binding protein n=2 Tax=Cellulomonas cellasea TaxID=43670 RepID=A0A0A0BCC0_9CELL|nr:nitroreductase/quinone reductase family protein [Cellulomonas cellasea]KGM03504.1 cation-binding protein [Cellulomonas cellasea DSM 20118]GEA87127.1 cation-binding protein [Cellulomonas cellasea]
MPNAYNDRIVDEFRAHHGRVAEYEGSRLLLLTTRGARTGRPHTTPLGYLPDGERVLVIASSLGAPTHPAWFHNVVADPSVTVEDGAFTYEARAEVLTGEERDRVYARAVEADPGWAGYQARTSRVIPVVALHRVSTGPPPGVPWGQALVLLHGAFRRELALVRDEVARGGTRLGAQLRVSCLTVCAGLHRHHEAEDTGMFPMLGQDPSLAPVLDRLRAEHAVIKDLLDELQAVVGADVADRDTTLREVDRLVDELGRHLAYEEEQLVPVLDAARA